MNTYTTLNNIATPTIGAIVLEGVVGCNMEETYKVFPAGELLSPKGGSFLYHSIAIATTQTGSSSSSWSDFFILYWFYIRSA